MLTFEESISLPASGVPAPGGAADNKAMCGQALYRQAAASRRSSSVSVKSSVRSRHTSGTAIGGKKKIAPPYVAIAMPGPTSSFEKSVAKKASVDSSLCSAYQVVRHG